MEISYFVQSQRDATMSTTIVKCINNYCALFCPQLPLVCVDTNTYVCFPGILYAVGGYDGATRQCLSTVEAYNPKSNTWNYISEMGTRRSGAGE